MPSSVAREGFGLFFTLPVGLILKRLSSLDEFLYLYCDDVVGGEVTIKLGKDEDGKARIEQTLRIGTPYA